MKISKKVIIIVIIAVLVVGAVVLAVYLKQVNNYQDKVQNMEFTDINIISIPDGKYIGESDVDLISAKVEVMVTNGKIVSIDLVSHKNGRGKPAEKILYEMIEKQTTNVDAISGATNSSIVIRKAVENALLGK